MKPDAASRVHPIPANRNGTACEEQDLVVLQHDNRPNCSPFFTTPLSAGPCDSGSVNLPTDGKAYPPIRKTVRILVVRRMT